MELDAQELQDLAGFLGRRFSDERARALAAEAGIPVPPSAGWTAVVTEAARRGRLAGLARVCQAAKPGDPGMAQLASLLPAPRRPGRAIAAAAGLAALVFAAVLIGQRGGEAAVAAVQPQAAPEEAAEDGVEIAQAAPAPIGIAPAEAAPAEATPAAPAPPEASRTQTSGLCRGPVGEVLGYFYAGAQAPGAQGQTVTLDRGSRVRADYPDRHNGFNASAALVCVLPAGTRVRLDAAPIAVPGAAVWVPLVGGSIL